VGVDFKVDNQHHVKKVAPMIIYSKKLKQHLLFIHLSNYAAIHQKRGLINNICVFSFWYFFILMLKFKINNHGKNLI